MSARSDAATSKKFHAGPGGIHCACCSPMFRVSARRAKPRLRRYARRVAKMTFRQEIRR
jgi:hypothetical protein